MLFGAKFHMTLSGMAGPEINAERYYVQVGVSLIFHYLLLDIMQNDALFKPFL